MTFEKKNNGQKGQSLVETMVAVFVLIVGITAAVGLANYALNSTTSVVKQVVGTGLAEEGIEAVKNERDQNWLKGSLASTCWNFSQNNNSGNCYTDWLKPNGGGGYDLTNASARFNNYLSLSTINSANSLFTLHNLTNGQNQFGVDFNDYSSGGFNGLFYSQSGQSNGSSTYYRNVYIQYDASTAPFNQTNMGKLIVKAQVWWTDRKCPATQTWPGIGNCSLEVQTYLTNWKNY